mgnify:CR=1 FL=1
MTGASASNLVNCAKPWLLRSIDITWHSSHLNGGWNPVCHLIGNMLYSLRHLKVDNRKDASTPQTFTCIVLFHVSTQYLCHLTAASAAASDVLITRGGGYQCIRLVLSADKANVSSSREHYTITLDPALSRQCSAVNTKLNYSIAPDPIAPSLLVSGRWSTARAADTWTLKV